MKNKERTQAKSLSKNLKGDKGKKSVKEFMKTESDLQQSVDIVISNLNKKYSSNIKIYQEKRYMLNTIVEDLSVKYSKYNFKTSNAKSLIRPDGGFIYAEKKGEKHIICISEMKYQKSTSGNAFERAAKNIAVCKDILTEEKYFPYVLFVQGDVVDTSNLVDRINSMNYNLPANDIYVVEEEYNIRPFTIILERNITITTEIKVINEVCERSIAYLFNKS